MLGLLIAITGAIMAASGHYAGFILVVVGAISTVMEQRWIRIIKRAPWELSLWDILTVLVVLLIMLVCGIAVSLSLGFDTVTFIRSIEQLLIGG